MDDIKDLFEKLTEEQKKYFLFKLYLNEDSDVIKKVLDKLDNEKGNIKSLTKMMLLAKVTKSLQETADKNIDTYKKSYESYKLILKKCAALADELNLDNSLQKSNLFTYLLWNGYFSKTKENRFQTQKRHIEFGLFPYDIMSGIGVCLNYSDMMKDYLTECGYPSALLINKVDKNLKSDYRPQIERKINKSNLSNKVLTTTLLPLSKRIGNHAFNLIEDSGKLYIYDATNFLLLEIENINTAKIVAGKGTFSLTPYFSYALNFSNLSKNTLDKLHTNKDLSSPYSRKDFIITWENCIDLFKDNSNLIEDYYDDTKNDILCVTEDLEKIKIKK